MTATTLAKLGQNRAGSHFENNRSYHETGLPCFAIEICLVSMNPTDRYRRSFLFNLVVVKFKYKCHVCVCSLVVVRQVVNYERFRDYKAGLPVGLGWFSWAGLVGLC